MAAGSSIAGKDDEGEKATADSVNIAILLQTIFNLLKFNYAISVPLVLLTLPPQSLFGQQVLVLVALAAIGTSGMFSRKTSLATIASVSLLALIVWGKIASDVYGLASQDSSVLLGEFMLIIYLLEASRTILSFESVDILLKGKRDDLSLDARARTREWAKGQLLNLGKLTIAAFGLSLGLLVLGSLVSVSFNQLAFSGLLALAAVFAILLLLTYRREPEQMRRRGL